MKKTIIFAALTLSSSLALAQAQSTPASPGMPAKSGEITAHNQQMQLLEQVVALRQDVQAASQAPSTCLYEGKAFSEGTIYQVGKVLLVCVERDWGMHVSGPGRSEGRELVWEPIGSERLKQYREITRVSANAK